LAVPAADLLLGKGERFASLPSNLPDPGTPLLGRDADLTALIGLLEQHRVVTVTGPGGIGKTRTAIEVCHRLASRFLDGIAFVSLAAVTDVSDLMPALANALGVKEAEGRSQEREPGTKRKPGSQEQEPPNTTQTYVRPVLRGL